MAPGYSRRYTDQSFRQMCLILLSPGCCFLTVHFQFVIPESFRKRFRNDYPIGTLTKLPGFLWNVSNYMFERVFFKLTLIKFLVGIVPDLPVTKEDYVREHLIVLHLVRLCKCNLGHVSTSNTKITFVQETREPLWSVNEGSVECYSTRVHLGFCNKVCR